MVIFFLLWCPSCFHFVSFVTQLASLHLLFRLQKLLFKIIVSLLH